jgi:hypothetical protein
MNTDLQKRWILKPREKKTRVNPCLDISGINADREILGNAVKLEQGVQELIRYTLPDW